MEFNKLIELDTLSKKSVKQYVQKRKLYAELLEDKGKHFVGIVGPRGVGKTTMLKQLAQSMPNSLYISMESFDGNMFTALQELKEKLKIANFFLDEVHAYENFDKQIQTIYELLDVKVFFTSSTALSMAKYKNDISRRVLLKNLFPFTLRDYIEFKNQMQVPSLRF